MMKWNPSIMTLVFSVMSKLLRKDVPVGSKVKLEGGPTSNTRQNSIEGTVTEVFDHLFVDGSEGNLAVDIRSDTGLWVRYLPARDAGIFYILKGNKYERITS